MVLDPDATDEARLRVAAEGCPVGAISLSKGGSTLALDGTEVVFEKYRVTACDAMVKVYDLGTIKHPGSSEPSAQTRCLILITRSRMRDLKEMYAATL